MLDTAESNFELFEANLQSVDSAADRVVETLVLEHGMFSPQVMVEHILSHPDDFAEFVGPMELALNNLDVERWDKGGAFYQRHKAHIGVGLSFVSLPLTFVSPEGSSLVETGFLSGDCTDTVCKRIAQTQMFVDLSMQPGELSLAYESKPIYAAVKLRIIHALARRKIKTKSGQSEVEPINQADSAMALSLFHAVVIKFLRANKLPYDQEEAEAYFYRWHVQGKLLGVPDELNADTLESYDEKLKPVFDARFFNEFENNEHFEVLMNGLLRALIRISFGETVGQRLEPWSGNKRLQEWFFYFIYMVKPEAAEFLPIPTGRTGKMFLRLLHSPRFQRIFDERFDVRLSKYLGDNYRFKH